MDPVAPRAADTLGQAQLLMLRKAMDTAVQSNQTLLAALPAPPAAGLGAHVDLRA